MERLDGWTLGLPGSLGPTLPARPRTQRSLGDVMPQDPKFEIPQELRQLAEENVERARQLYVQFMDGVGQTMAAWSSASSDVVAPGFRQVQEHAVKLANENADAAFKLAKDVAQAKDSPRIDRLADAIRAIPDEVVCRADAGVWAANGAGIKRYEESPKLMGGTAPTRPRLVAECRNGPLDSAFC